MQIDVIDTQKTAMIVVDMQNDFVAAGAAMETPAARAIVPKLEELDKSKDQIGVQFIRFGDDEGGKAMLEYLDCGLGLTRLNLFVAIRMPWGNRFHSEI